MQPQDIVVAAILFLLAAFSVVGLVFASRYMQAQLGATKYAELVRTIRTYIQAAEQMAKSGQIQKDERYQWVVTQIVAKFPQLSKDQIDAYVESAVYALNAGATLVGSLETFDFGKEEDA